MDIDEAKKEVRCLCEELFPKAELRMEKMIALGEALDKVRIEMVGDFGLWIEENMPITKDAARNYMKIARHKEAVLAGEAETFSGALEFANRKEANHD